MFGSLATLIVGLCAGLIAYYTGFATIAFSSTPDELQYIPKAATVVAYANVHDVMNSELRRRLRGIEPSHQDAGREEFQNRTGINIETDIDHVVACMTAKSETSGGENGLVLATGRFDQVRLEGLARGHGGTVTDYKGKRLLTHTTKNQESFALAFLKPGLVAFGGEPLVRQAIDLGQGGENITGNDEVMRLVREMDEGNAWAVGRFDALASRARLPQEIAGQIPPITWFAASGRVNGGITGMLKAEARDDQSAQNLRDVVRGFMALAKLQAGSKPQMQAMLQSLELGGTGKTVAISFSVPAEVLDGIAPKPPQERNP